MKVRKKPVVVDAALYTGPDMSPDLIEILVGKTWRIDKEGFMCIQTLEGVMEATPGDWIIKGVKNECYPCKPDIFDVTYEAVES